jgi:hypothetical protein
MIIPNKPALNPLIAQQSPTAYGKRKNMRSTVLYKKEATVFLDHKKTMKASLHTFC